MNERKAKFESAPIQNIPKSSAVTNEKDQVDVSEKLATLPARKIFESKNDQKYEYLSYCFLDFYKF